jgi:putative oxidoreductase
MAENRIAEPRLERGRSVTDSAAHVEDVRGSGVYPATGPFPEHAAPVRSPAAFAHPEERGARMPLQQRAFETAALVAGRAIFGGYFLYSGINHFVHRKMLTEYARSKGVAAPELAVTASGLLILAGGLSIVTGIQPKVGAALIATFLAGVSPQMHAFWNERDPQQRTNEMVNFTKNMALIGSSFLAAAHPEPWPRHLRIAPERALIPVRA